MRLNSFISGVAVAITATVMLAGCSSAPVLPPATDALSKADLAIRQAEQAGAGATAPLEMRQARDMLTEAREKIRDNKTAAEATRMADMAKVLAELAQSRADEARAVANRAEAQKDIDAIRHESGLN